MFRVMIFTVFYLPGFKGGGPIKTVSSLFAALSSEVTFDLITLDRDLGDKNAYPGIQSNCWSALTGSSVFYASPDKLFFKIVSLIKNYKGDVIHLNSFFSFYFSILPVLVSRWLRKDLFIIIGPRGEFSTGALNLKYWKKALFIKLAKIFGLYKNIIWHASSNYEADDIRRVIGLKAKIKIACDIAIPKENIVMAMREISQPLRVVFLSRISPMKNLNAALAILKNVKSTVIFHVYGPIEDKNYWTECQACSISLPENISYQYSGELFPAQVPDMLAQYDLFFLPTLGENFGHVIAEALSSGLPVLISDQTPWRDLSKKRLGWDLPLQNLDLFAVAIDECANMAVSDYENWRKSIRTWALKNIGNDEVIEQNRQLFKGLS